MNLKQFDKIVTDQLSRSELVLMGTAMSLFRMSSLLRRCSIRFRPALTAWTFLIRSQK
jgi:hypothetical protein